MNDSVLRDEIDGDLSQLISFSVDGEEYGLDILRVKEVIRAAEVTRLPRAPAFVKGIINLRGDVIPIIDLREKFSYESVEYTDATRVIVVDVNGRLVGMIVDEASQVLRIPDSQIEPPPPIVGGLPNQFIKGVGKLDDRLIVLLNIDKILSSDEMEELEGIGSGTPVVAQSK